MGRPSKYREEFVEQARKLCQLGATDVELADFFGVERNSIWRWATVHEAFANALKSGKEAADDRVQQSLYHRAVGYTFDAVKIMQHQGEVIQAAYREHVPPDTTAMIFWLKNRRPAEWRDRQQHEHTGKDGGPIETADVTDRDRAKAMAALMLKSRGDDVGNPGGV